MRNKLKYTIVGFVGVLLPTMSFAFSLKDSTFAGTIMYILGVLAILNPIMIVLAFIVFFWGLSKFILNAGNKDAIATGKDYMLWGVLALFILLTFRTIIGLITNELEFGDAQNTPFLKTDAVQGNVTTGGSGFTR